MFLKNKKTFVIRMNYSVKNLRNKIILANTRK